MKSEKDYFKQIIRTFCRVENIPPRKVRFTKHNNYITVNIKNESEDGLDTNCFRVMNLIYNVIGSIGVKFSQTPFLIPSSGKVDRITISFEEQDYQTLLDQLFNQNIE
ncbi:hypothetical protein [Ornithinibacillus bavariensis]|uniref:hypothetical protein n=1 Tax=Ornithinibacillus bavariensis TaxID=545502 RepID=UPI000ED3E7CE|nr:hypothetical protein [Ornithinibacillus sp.]